MDIPECSTLRQARISSSSFADFNNVKLMHPTINSIMKAIEATTDSARRRARRLIEAFQRCGTALTPEQQVLLGQLKRTLDDMRISNQPPVSPPDFSGWAPLGI
jgi:hypothetical protein